MDSVQHPNLNENWQSTPKGYPRQDVEGWVRQLAEVQHLSREKGYGYDDFQRMRSSADPNERALGTTHHKFYDHDVRGEATNGDHVTLMWNGQTYEVSNNGRHRVQAAKNIGLGTMPAEVTAREEHMDECQKHGRTSNLLMPKDRDGNERTNLNIQGGSPAVTQSGADSSRPLWERGPADEPLRKDRIGR